MKAFFLVGIGGFAGSYLRYLLSVHIDKYFLTAFPLGTFLVNMAGCFIIGMVYGLSARLPLGAEYRLLLATGFCGGFTTFATFSMEEVILAGETQFLMGFLYSGLSLIAGFFLAWLGLWLVK